jgi:hypothetical protein
MSTNYNPSSQAPGGSIALGLRSHGQTRPGRPSRKRPRQKCQSLALRFEYAYVEAAQRFWLEITGAPPDQFLPTTLKRHNPKTVRKNVGENDHGCLRIDVNRSSGLYRKIEGWAKAIMSGA